MSGATRSLSAERTDSVSRGFSISLFTSEMISLAISSRFFSSSSSQKYGTDEYAESVLNGSYRFDRS